MQKNEKGTSELKEVMNQVAQTGSMSKKFSFVTGDGEKYAQIVSAMGMNAKALPQIAIDAIQMEARPTYPFFNRDNNKQEVTAKSLIAFANDFLNGDLEEIDKKQKEDAKEPEESHVVNFDDKSFARAKRMTEWVVVLFTAPWSSEAHYASQAFRQVALNFTRAEARGVNAAFGRVDVTQPSEINRDHTVSVPSVLLFQQGKEVQEPYEGEVTAAGLLSYLSKFFTAEAHMLEGPSEVSAHLATAGPHVIAVMDAGMSTKQSRLVNYFKEIALETRGYFTFAIVDPSTADGAPALQGLKAPSVALINMDGLRELIDIHSDTSKFKESILKRLEATRVPTVLPFDQEHGPLVSRFDNIATVMVFLPSSEWDANVAIVKEAAKDDSKYRGRVLFLLIDVAKTPQVADMLKVSKSPNDLPAVRIDGRKSAIKGMYQAPADFKFEAKSLAALADSYLAGALEAVPRSDDVPEGAKATEHGVSIIVGSNFAKAVEAAALTLVYIYSPTCKYCTLFTPIYEAFAKELPAGVRVLKMDGAENDAPSYVKLPGYPSVFLFKESQKKTPLLYDGQPNIMGLRAFWKSQVPKAKLTPQLFKTHEEL